MSTSVDPNKDPNRVVIFDTTLRDGEQSPGASMNREEKLQVARALARLKVDIIEAGFPIASPGDFDSVKAIAEEVDGPVICGLARSLEKDIKSAGEALKNAKRSRIHVFLATSAIHREFKLKKAKDEILKQAVTAVKFAKTYSQDIEFSPEDASRTEPEFLCEVVQAVIDAGATTVNIPDTVGYAVPEQYGQVIHTLKTKVPNIDKAIISVHCHDDLGLAVANSLAGVKNGARQVECTINGIGERAGNAALEEIVMALRTRHDFFSGYHTAIDSKKILQTSRLVSNLTGIHVQRNKAIVGENAFAHESGIHQDGFLKERTTYEIMHPGDIGLEQSNLVLGKHSGKHAFGSRLKELGYSLSDKELADAFERFKVLCDKKKTIYDADLEAIVEDQLESAPPIWELELLQVSSGNKSVPTATVCLKKNDERFQDAAIGDGPIDAMTNAINRITGLSAKLLDFQVHSVSKGQEAQGEVDVKVEVDGTVIHGRGVSTDIIEASAKAYLNALCRAAARAPDAGEAIVRPGHIAPKPAGVTP
ncbi:MAG TPA: 2-isopropylmalate synthase [Planctomycetota bacterium]|nr:2-isopropylmalate synthase [Planctomycetota bacterium]